MTKGEIIRFCREYDQTEKRYRQLVGEENKLKARIQQIKNPPEISEPSLVASYICWFIILELVLAVVVIAILFVYALLNGGLETFPIPIVVTVGKAISSVRGLLEYDLFSLPVTALAIALVPAAVLAIPLAPAMTKWEKSENEKAIRDYESAQGAIPGLEQRLQTMLRQTSEAENHLRAMKSRGIVHPDYLYCASVLADYLEKGRADTLKEAINLYEVERSERERQREERKYREEMRRRVAIQQETLDYMADETSRAADAADSAARWSAATTLLTAAEIERQRKKDR